MLTAAAVLRPSSGRFWDSESESECEDLGDAEAHHPTVSSSPAPTQGTPAVVAPSATVLPLARGSATPPRRSPSTPPRRAKPPWKSLATRKILPAGNPGGLPAAGATDCRRARRRRGVDYGSRSVPAAGPKFGTRRARCAGHGPPPGSRPE
jgi:hypothetical protein